MTANLNPRDAEYRRRYNAIVEHRSLSRAAEELDLPYTALAKWYHDHRVEFEPTVVETIRSNSGRPVITSRVATLRRPTPRETEQADVQSAQSIVDAIFERMRELREENEDLKQQLTIANQENEELRSRYNQANTGESIRKLLQEVSR